MKRLVVALLLLAANAFAGSPAEQQVANAVKDDHVTVVHLWAPWCGNCQAELKSGGWLQMAQQNPEVKFLFVSVWNNGDDGKAMLEKFGLTSQTNVSVLADPGPRSGANKLKQFNGLPLSWIPATWVYKGGELRYALNYGEIHFDMLKQLLADSVHEW